MPILFVHGVNVRDGSDQQKHIQFRDQLFKQIVVPAFSTHRDIPTFNPYWGKYGCRPIHSTGEWKSVPGLGGQTFGPDDVEMVLAETAVSATEGGSTLRSIARQSLPDLVDVLMAAAVNEIPEKKERELASLADRLTRYALAHPQPDWLAKVTTDEDVLTTLLEEANKFAGEAEEQTFGAGDVWNWLTRAKDSVVKTVSGIRRRVTDGVTNAARTALDRTVELSAMSALAAASYLGSDELVNRLRKPLHAATAQFLGDVMVYIKNRDEKNSIVDCICDEWKAALKARTKDDPLLVVCHSLGGVIAYDILTHYAPQLTCDYWVTVGSQVAFFVEANLARSGIQPGQTTFARPAGAAYWINVFNLKDVLSFAVAPVFGKEAVDDYVYATPASIHAAHTVYFERTTLYQRMAERLKVAHAAHALK